MIQRKVVKVGPSCLMTALGANWTAKHNVKKGDDVKVVEVGNGLLILPPHEGREEVDIESDGNLINLRSQLMTFYFFGADVITVTFEKEKQDSIMKVIEEIVGKHLLGMVIKDSDETSCIIESFSESGPMNLDDAIKNSLQKILKSSEEGIKAFRTKNPDVVSSIVANHDYVKKFCFCAHRLINKNAHVDLKLVTAYSRALDKIIEISNHLRHIAKHHALKKRTKVSIEAMEQLHELLFLMFQAYYNPHKLNDFFNHHKEIGKYYYDNLMEVQLKENFGMVRDLAMNLVRQAIYINYKKE